MSPSPVAVFPVMVWLLHQPQQTWTVAQVKAGGLLKGTKYAFRFVVEAERQYAFVTGPAGNLFRMCDSRDPQEAQIPRPFKVRRPSKVKWHSMPGSLAVLHIPLYSASRATTYRALVNPHAQLYMPSIHVNVKEGVCEGLARFYSRVFSAPVTLTKAEGV